VKLSIEEKEGIPAPYQRIIWAGRELDVNLPPREYPNFGFPHVLHLILRLRGPQLAQDDAIWDAFRAQYQARKSFLATKSSFVKTISPPKSIGAGASSKIKRTQAETVWRIEIGDVRASAKIISFDLDGTLISTKSGAKFAKDAQDWKWRFHLIPIVLKELSSKGFKIVIFTNQKGIGSNEERLEVLITKLTAISEKLGLPIDAYIATGDDQFRKPDLGMWQLFLSGNGQFNDRSKLKVVFVGDAAGRKSRKAAKGKAKAAADFSDSDRQFAVSAGISFFDETEAFQNGKLNEWSRT